MNQARMAAQQRSNRRSSRGISPGRSMAQFGHAGHAGKSQSKAQKHQKAGINTPSRGPGSNPNMGQTPPKKTATVSTPKKTTFKDKLISGARTLGELKHIRDVLTPLISLSLNLVFFGVETVAVFFGVETVAVCLEGV